MLIDLSWASSRLEGNTYSRLDTQNLIEFGQAAEGKDIQETQMILNHKTAIEMLIEEADQVGFNPFTFLNLHAILSKNLLRRIFSDWRIHWCRETIPRSSAKWYWVPCSVYTRAAWPGIG